MTKKNIIILEKTELSLSKVHDSAYQVTDIIEWRMKFFGIEDLIRIPKGFITDGASSPRFSYSFFPPFTGRHVEASVLHDFLYSSKSGFRFSRFFSDAIFKEALIYSGVGRVKAGFMFAAVRCFGQYAWELKKIYGS